MTTQYYTAATLDGFIATSDHSIDWLNALGANFVELRYTVVRSSS